MRHDLEFLVDGKGDPIAVICADCGRKWKLEEMG